MEHTDGGSSLQFSLYKDSVGKVKYKNIGYHYALYGSLAFGLHQMIIEGLEESGNPHSYEVAQFLKFTNFFKKNTRTLDCTFNIDQSLKDRLDKLRLEAEIAVREGGKHLVLTDKKVDEKKIKAK